MIAELHFQTNREAYKQGIDEGRKGTFELMKKYDENLRCKAEDLFHMIKCSDCMIKCKDKNCAFNIYEWLKS